MGGHRVRRGGLDPIDLPREQRGRAGVRLGDRQQHHAAELRAALGVPVVRVGGHLEPLARHEGDALERAGARGVRREGGPGGLGALGRVGDRGRHRLQLRLPVGRRGHEQVREVDGQEGVRLGGRQLDGHGVERLGGAQCRHPRGGDADLIGRELRRRLVEHLADVPRHRGRVERRAVVELHPRAECEHPLRLVVPGSPSTRRRGPGSGRSPCPRRRGPTGSARRTSGCR